MIDMEIEPALKLITELVDNKLRDYGQFVCDIYKGTSTAGDASYFVEICFTDQAQRVPAHVTVELRSELRSALLDAGDQHFPYLSYNMDQQAA
jgi:hypothetical protein